MNEPDVKLVLSDGKKHTDCEAAEHNLAKARRTVHKLLE